jgi:protein-disulfide isomerase
MNQETKVTIGMVLVCVVMVVGIFAYGGKQASKMSPDQGEKASVDPAILVRDDSRKIESPGSAVTLVEFLDFECEACGAAYPIVKQILKEYDGRINFVLRNFPLHANSVLAAKSAEAAGEQGKFWEMYDKLFQNQREWGEQKTPQTEFFRKYAQEIGLDMDAFNEVIASKKYEDKVMRDQRDGESAGVQGTPTFYLNGKQLRGIPRYEQLKQMIDEEIKNASQASTTAGSNVISQ